MNIFYFIDSLLTDPLPHDHPNGTTMSILNEFRALQQALKIQQDRLESLKHDEQLSNELAFEKKLLTLLKRHNLQLEQLSGFIPGSLLQPSPDLREPSAVYKASKVGKAGKSRVKP